MTRDPAELHREGRVSAEVALARMVLSGLDPAQIAERSEVAGNPALARIARERADALMGLRAFVESCHPDHTGVEAAQTVGAIAAMFDRAVMASAESSVAAYSLGQPEILHQATREIVAWAENEDLLGPETAVLDLGCGMGRVADALALRAGSVLGLDVSPRMIAEARRRYRRHNLRFDVTAGVGLSTLSAASFDLVLAVDSFPYLMQAGAAIAERHVSDAARLLRPGGALAILNLSYRDDLAADQADAARWATTYGFTLVRPGGTPFKLWDGTVFLFRGHGSDRARAP
jgi:ubiquinone/menaquinone biosynthesis C-methylase UbiE